MPRNMSLVNEEVPFYLKRIIFVAKIFSVFHSNNLIAIFQQHILSLMKFNSRASFNKYTFQFMFNREGLSEWKMFALKGYSTPYFDFCSNCSICTIKTYERLKEREKKILTAENCARKAKFRYIRGPEVKLTSFEARDQWRRKENSI